MKVRDLVKELVNFDLDDEIIILTKQDDIQEVNGEKFPNILFGKLEGSGAKEGEKVPVLAIVGDYDKYRKEEPAKEVEAVVEEAGEATT